MRPTKPEKIEPDKQFVDSITKVNETNISLNKTNIEGEENNDKKEKQTFSLYDLQKISLLGSGASGQVFLFEHISTKKPFALKIIGYRNDEKFKKLIETEVKILHSCKSDNIIRCKASFINEGNINILLEFMDKGTLTDILKKVKNIPEDILGILSYQIIRGLEYLQKEKKIVHRDIKPSNILINSRGQVKISDFGVSSSISDSFGFRDTLVGTYLYMAPERIKGKNYTFNSDIWSVGMTILECAIGKFPYLPLNDNEPIADVWTLGHLIDNKNTPRAPESEFSKEFCDFISKCLIVDPGKRPNPSELLKDPFIIQYENQPNSVLANWLKNIL